MFARMYPLLLVAGLVVWAIWFVLMYSILSIVCNITPPTTTNHPLNWLNVSLLALTFITAVMLFYFAYCYSKKQTSSNTASPTKSFINWIAIAVFIVAAVATGAIGIMTLFFPPCI